MKNNLKVVTYHGACLDGSSAAAVFKMAHPDARFFPVKSSVHTDIKDEVLDLLGDNKQVEVYVLDNPWFVRDFAKTGAAVTVLDHHMGEYNNLSAIAKEYDNVRYVFDNEKSGASLTWSYLFPDKKMPKFIWHIEDGDLYRYEDKTKSKLIESYAAIYLDDLDKFIEFINADLDDLYKKAQPVLDYQNMLIDYYLRNASALHFNVSGYKIKAYNVASIRPIVSDFGNAMSEKVKEPVLMFKVFGNTVNLSFRSASESFKPYPVDLAQACGGNGHKLAAGAAMPLQEFLERLEEAE